MTTEQREAIDRLSSLLKKGKYGVAGKTLLYEDYYMLKNVLEVVENQERKIIRQQEKIEKRDNAVRKIITRLDNDYKRITETKAKKKEHYLDDYTRCRLKAYRTKTREIKDYIEQQYFERKAENVES